MYYIIFIFIIFITSCGTPQEIPQNATTSDTKKISHIMGETFVPIAPKKVVALTGEATEALLALGIVPQAAVSSYTADRSWYPHIASYMSNVQIIGEERQINLEQLAVLQPDVIIGIKARQENIYPILSKIAPTVYKENFYGEWKKNFFTVAEVVNQLEKATNIMKDWESKRDILQQKLKQAGYLDKTTALYRFTPKGARYYGNLGFASSIVKELGFKRPQNHDTEQFSYEISQELIPNMNAEQAFYFVFSTDNSSSAYQNTTNYITNTLFTSLDHKGINIYEVDNNTWNKSYGILAAYEILNEIEKIFFTEKRL